MAKRGEKKPISTDEAFMRSLGVKQRLIISRMRGGAVLHKQFQNGITTYFLEGHGEVPRDTVARLLARKAVVENADAMFGVGITFSLGAMP